MTPLKRRNEAGLTMIELMISVLLFSIVIGVALKMGSTMVFSMSEGRRMALVERSARISLEIVADALRSSSPGVPSGQVTDLVGCSAGTAPNAVRVTNGAGGSDMLETIHASAGTVTSLRAPYGPSSSELRVAAGADFRAGDYAVVTNLEAGAVVKVIGVSALGSGEWSLQTQAPSSMCSGAVLPAGGFTVGSLVLRARISRFYIDRSASVGGIPTLMLDPDGDGAERPEPLADGIEDLQVAIGVDVNGDGTVTDTASTADEWFYNAAGDADPPAGALPRAVRVTVTARETQQGNDWSYLRNAAEDRPAATAEDGYRRRVLSTTVELRNLEGSP
jgi:hypothetical protein